MHRSSYVAVVLASVLGCGGILSQSGDDDDATNTPGTAGSDAATDGASAAEGGGQTIDALPACDPTKAFVPRSLYATQADESSATLTSDESVMYLRRS